VDGREMCALLVFAFLLDRPINIAAVRLTIALT
jgi:hypothetical protein